MPGTVPQGDTEPGQCQHQDTSSHLVDGRWLCDVCDLDTDVYREDETE